LTPEAPGWFSLPGMGFLVPDLRPRSVWVSRRLPLRIGEETQQAARFG
jgi:hypothetical protein